jgi:hypothetical protein
LLVKAGWMFNREAGDFVFLREGSELTFDNSWD